jgi:oligoendopeptidase F
MTPRNIKSIFLLCTLGVIMVLGTALTAPAQVQEAPTRDQIEEKYKWNLADLFESDEMWERVYQEVQQALPRFEEYKGKLAESPEVLAECLELSDSLGNVVHRLWVYSGLKSDEDTRESKYQEMLQQVSVLRANFSQAVSFLQPEMLKIGEEKLLTFLDESERLNVYRFYIEDLLRQQEHVLSPEVEDVMAQMAVVTRGPREIFTRIDNADIKFGTVTDEDGNEIELTRQRYSQLLESHDRRVRKEASETYEFEYLNYENTLGACLSASVNKDWTLAKIRGYNSCLEARLDGDDIPTDVFHNLIETVNNNLEPLHRYVSIRKKALGVDTLFKYDMYVPLVEETSMEYDYDEAIKTVLEGLGPLGEEYVKNMENGFNSRWIDVYETQGKRSGAYNWGNYSVHPYLLLNFIGTINNVFTIAHEMGHAMHAYYTNSHEPLPYAGHSILCAEVASTCNEAILMHHLLDKVKDRDDRLYLLNYYIRQISGTFFTQVMFSEFEYEVHSIVESGGALSAKKMREIYRGIYEKYYGPDYFLEENKDLGCLRIGHFYRQYYVYTYAASYAASQLMATKIMNKEKGILETYENFLKTGVSKYPIDILKDAGIDMTTPEPYENVIKIFSDLVDEFEQLLLEES